MTEVVHNTPESLPVAQQVGRRVMVSIEVRLDPNSAWQPIDTEKFEPWEGQIRPLPKQSARNGNVNVMPEEPRGDRDPSLHPRVIDLSARAIESTAAEVRHVLHDYSDRTLGSRLYDAHYEQP
jgi:hypothetical protein